MGANVSRRSNDEDWPSIRGQQPDFIHREERDRLHKLKDLGVLRSTALFLSHVDFETDVLRHRLTRALHDTTLADGTRLDTVLTFDDAQLEDQLLLQAMYLVEDQSWDEVADALRLASQLSYCELPVNITQQDLEKHHSKETYLADPRVVALWKMVGRHVNFGGELGRFELFTHGNGALRAIKEEEDFTVDLTPLSPHHQFQQHANPQDPPTRHRIYVDGNGNWEAGAHGLFTDDSFSTLLMGIILVPTFGDMRRTTKVVSRDARGGVLAHLLNQPPNQAAGGTTSVLTYTHDDTPMKLLLVTPFDCPFIAFVIITAFAPPNGITAFAPQNVQVSVSTTETPAAGVAENAPFKQRFPRTTALARPVLGPIAPIVFDGEDPNQDA
ncbi:unnamed protein product [Vitrella brassicaformis CCMP3155]|uniref:Uncharacterized protein n=1 Tax=Vitrella brassicaformis (strain CCMP3155) TaxID=1169540 RepID=A0A0G4EHZ8_VITBC|nr:unnamed protein product [Vitrella brassicaformis CCMP3155]|eukprot:CEL95585.1 unnamed protein product [Vitrella brassicaformis CCMP3155]